MKRADLKVGMILECRINHVVSMNSEKFPERYNLVTSIHDHGYTYITSHRPDYFIVSEMFERHDGWIGLKYHKRISP